MSKTNILIGSILTMASVNASAGLNCSMEYLNSLEPAKQLQELTACNSIIDIKLNLLKKQNKFNSVQNGTPDLNESLPAPQGGNMPSQGGAFQMNAYPEVMTSYDQGEAEIAWSDGRRMTIQKGRFISKDVRVNSISPEGVELIDNSKGGQTFFIGFGKPRAQQSINSQYPM